MDAPRFHDQDQDQDSEVPRPKPRPRLVKTGTETSRDQDSSLQSPELQAYNDISVLMTQMTSGGDGIFLTAGA